MTAPRNAFQDCAGLERHFVNLSATENMEPRPLAGGLYYAIPADFLSMKEQWSVNHSIAVTCCVAEELERLVQMAARTGWFSVSSFAGPFRPILGIDLSQAGTVLVFTPNAHLIGTAAEEIATSDDAYAQALITMKEMARENDVFKAFAPPKAILNSMDDKHVPENSVLSGFGPSLRALSA